MDTKEKIFRKSIELFAKYSYEEVSMRQIAKAAGVNCAMISYYFGNKEALYKQTISVYMEEFKNIVLSINTDDEKRFIKEFIKTHLKIIQKRGNYAFYTILKESIDNFEQIKDLKTEYFDPIAETLWGVLRSGIDKKIFKPYSSVYIVVKVLFSPSLPPVVR